MQEFILLSRMIGMQSNSRSSRAPMEMLAAANRIQESTNQIQYVRFFDDFPVQPLSNL